jgi:hypothetical protein
LAETKLKRTIVASARTDFTAVDDKKEENSDGISTKDPDLTEDESHQMGSGKDGNSSRVSGQDGSSNKSVGKAHELRQVPQVAGDLDPVSRHQEGELTPDGGASRSAKTADGRMSRGTTQETRDSNAGDKDEELKKIAKLKKIAEEKIRNIPEKIQEMNARGHELKQQLTTKIGEATTTATGAVRNKVKRRNVPILPPRFFVSSNSTACDKAFEHAKEGRPFVVHEGLIGAIHFEGRICEELLRLSKDGSLRCFMPYDCEKPRLRLAASQIQEVKSIPGVFLGRFHMWEVHTLLKVFVFCSPDEQDRYEWIRFLTPSAVETKEKRPLIPVASVAAEHLKDLSRARRWKPSTRNVLNDRILLKVEESSQPQGPQLAEMMLDKVLKLGEDPDLVELGEFIDLTCRLKAITLQNLSDDELKAFWMNVYHCLLLHGRVLLRTPHSHKEVDRFCNRMSYLVGVRPYSLKEIERHILKVPVSDRVAANAGQARGRQFLAMCCLCGRRQQGGSATPVKGTEAKRRSKGDRGDSKKSSPPKDGSPNSPRTMSPKVDTTSPRLGERKALPNEKLGQPEGDVEQDFSPTSSGGSFTRMESPESGSAETSRQRKKLGLKGKCIPKPNVEQMKGNMAKRLTDLRRLPQGLLRRTNANACLYISSPPPVIKTPPQDMKVAFCLNRGNASCLPNIPMFCASHLSEQMEETCKLFCKDFVKLVEKDGKVTRAIFPHCCRGLKRHLINDYQALLAFVWQFLPKDRGEYDRKTQVRFSRYQREPRRRQDLTRLVFARPELNVDPQCLRSPEFQVMAGAALALAGMVEATTAEQGAMEEAKPDDVRLDVKVGVSGPSSKEISGSGVISKKKASEGTDKVSL